MKIALSLLIIAVLVLPAHAGTIWTLRAQAIVPIEDAERMREIARAYDPDPASTGGFTVRLSATGEEPATHVACDSVFTEKMLEAFKKVLSAPTKESLTRAPEFWKLEAKTGELKESNISISTGEWAFEKTLGDAGLKVIRGDDGLAEKTVLESK